MNPANSCVKNIREAIQNKGLKLPEAASFAFAMINGVSPMPLR
jgi:hypothetical protein